MSQNDITLGRLCRRRGPFKSVSLDQMQHPMWTPSLKLLGHLAQILESS